MSTVVSPDPNIGVYASTLIADPTVATAVIASVQLKNQLTQLNCQLALINANIITITAQYDASMSALQPIFVTSMSNAVIPPPS